MKRASKTAKAVATRSTPRKTKARKGFDADKWLEQNVNMLSKDEAEQRLRLIERMRGRKFIRPKGW